jgi:proteasome assembly chaperone 3
MAHLTPKTLLGGSTPERETVGQLYATQIASTIATKNSQENRTLVFGLGLSKFEANRESFYDILDLVNKCL